MLSRHSRWASDNRLTVGIDIGKLSMRGKKILMLLIALVLFVPPASGTDTQVVEFILPNHASSYELAAAGKTVAWAAQRLADLSGIPSEYLLLYRRQDWLFDGVVVANSHLATNRLALDDRLADSDVVNVFVRPVTGDHIHSIYNVWIHDGSAYRLLRPFYDAELLSKNDAHGGETEYYFAKLHNGLHTHGKGLIHVHPWTSPLWFHATDGLGATLEHWLDDVGVKIRQYPYRPTLSLEFSNGIYFVSKTQFKNIIANKDVAGTTRSYTADKLSTKMLAGDNDNVWTALHWKHYLDFENHQAPDVITDDLGKIWLGRNLAVVVLVYGPRTDIVAQGADFATTVTDDSLNRDISEIVAAKLDSMKTGSDYFSLKQFDGGQYPSPYAVDGRYAAEDKQYRPQDAKF